MWSKSQLTEDVCISFISVNWLWDTVLSCYANIESKYRFWKVTLTDEKIKNPVKGVGHCFWEQNCASCELQVWTSYRLGNLTHRTCPVTSIRTLDSTLHWCANCGVECGHFDDFWPGCVKVFGWELLAGVRTRCWVGTRGKHCEMPDETQT
jgi:hypothetical protein